MNGIITVFIYDLPSTVTPVMTPDATTTFDQDPTYTYQSGTGIWVATVSYTGAPETVTISAPNYITAIVELIGDADYSGEVHLAPLPLYAYTDVTLNGITYYGWGGSEQRATFYTLSATPEAGDVLYTGSGNFYPTYTDDPTDLRYGVFTITNPLNTVYQTDGSTYIRDDLTENPNSRGITADTTIPNLLKTVYTDTTTLQSGLSIYNNFGIELEQKVGTVLSSTSFILQNEPGTLVFEQSTAGTYTLALAAGTYNFIVSGAGGGGAVAMEGDYVAGASGGTGAYGIFTLEVPLGDNLTMVIGTGGTGATITDGQAASTAGGTTTISTSNLGTILVLEGAGAGYAYATASESSAVVGSGGTYSTTLTVHSLNNGISGSTATTEDGSQSVGYTNNPSPYTSYGEGGGFSYNSGAGTSLATNGGAGYIRIESV